MVRFKLRNCFVPGCKTGYRLTRKENAEKGVRNKQLFAPRKSCPDTGFPVLACPLLYIQCPSHGLVHGLHSGLFSRPCLTMRDAERHCLPVFHLQDSKTRAIWEQIICRTDRPLTRFDSVCELHFKEDDIVKYFETKLPGGVVDRIERERYRLKDNVVPSIFPPQDCILNLKKKRSARIPPVAGSTEDCKISENAVPSIFQLPKFDYTEELRSSPVEKQSFEPYTQDYDVSEVGEDCGMSEVESEPFDFQVLMKEALNILLPSDMWTVGVLKGSQVIFANWSDGDTFEARKRVLVAEDLKVKIFFGNMNASLGNMKEVHSLAEVAAFLIVIDQLDICPNTRSPGCLGYITPRDNADEGTSVVLCHHCQKAERDALRLNSGIEAIGRVGFQNKMLKKVPKSGQLGHCLLKKKKRDVLPEKGVIADGKLSPEGAIKCICGKARAEGNTDTEMAEKVDIEEWAPPPEWRSLATPMRLLSPPPEDIFRSTSTQPEALERRREEGTSSLDIETLVRDVPRIPLPSDAWTLGVVKGRRLIFASWKVGKVLEAEKRLVVDEDLSVKVIFGNMILAIDEIRDVKKFEDIGRYLYIVDKMGKCGGIGTGRRAASCPGYFIHGQVQGMRSCLSRCAYCQGASEELTRIRRIKGGPVQVRAEAQGKVWKNLKKLSGLYPEMKRSVKASA